MKRKSTKYNTPDAGGWLHACDDLFLAQFRGRPCEVCGKTESYYQGRTVRSHGHHLLSKELHRLYRYNVDNIVVLCPKHHLGSEMSPHSHDGVAQALFYKWVETSLPERYALFVERHHHKFNHEWKYRIKYEELGGEIKTVGADGNLLPMKDWKPLKHKTKVRKAEER